MTNQNAGEFMEQKKLGRPPGLRVGKNRQIRLTDHQWKVFREKLGVAWLRDRIEDAEAVSAYVDSLNN